MAIASSLLIRGRLMASGVNGVRGRCDHLFSWNRLPPSGKAYPLMANPQKLSQRERKRRQRRSAHNAHLKRTYGIDYEEYELILAAQGGKCAICGGGTSARHFSVDHDHKTGEVRGLLCKRCNIALARFMDSRRNVGRAYRYLKEGAGKVEAILGREVRTPDVAEHGILDEAA